MHDMFFNKCNKKKQLIVNKFLCNKENKILLDML